VDFEVPKGVLHEMMQATGYPWLRMIPLVALAALFPKLVGCKRFFLLVIQSIRPTA
jgi:hypothetical protein